MASPVMAPPSPPRRRKSYAGAIVLIVLGVIFLLHNFGVVSAWHFYARWWPLIIILVGVIKLIEYYQAKNEGAYAQGVTFGTIVLLFFVIVSGLSISKAEGVNWRALGGEMGIDDGDIFHAMGENAYTYEDKLQKEFPAGGNLKVVCDRGNININDSDDGMVRVMIHKKVWAANQGDADNANQSSKPTIEINGTAVLVNANTQSGGKHAVEDDMDIFIPRKADVALSTRHGDVNVVNREGLLSVSHQQGTANFEDITGNVDVNGEKITVRATRIKGNLTVQGRVTEVTAEDVSGSATLNGDNFDEVRVSKIGKTFAFKSYRSDLEFAGLSGDFDMSSDDLRASNVTGPVRVITRSKTIHLDDVTGDVRIENSNGDVEVHAAKLGNYDVRNHHGDVTVSVPAKATFTVEARTQHGDAASDFTELKVQNGDNQGLVTGNVGNGGPKLAITTDGADVNIRKTT